MVPQNGVLRKRMAQLKPCKLVWPNFLCLVVMFCCHVKLAHFGVYESFGLWAMSTRALHRYLLKNNRLLKNVLVMIDLFNRN